ncbi:hypothetical protein [Halospeciosus flavus]|uniref:DUF8075 domain-containing protein n=1 Tax=Halospeciosus flavus TaxID=3032283 RepID=A0ABD5Z4L0_9EURY|nr:hypothetical protein [Halospeciosus flavus]
MEPIHFEEADSDDRTHIGEGMTKFARKRGHLETGDEENRHYLVHEDGCESCGAAIEAGDSFYLDPETGEVLCEECGDERMPE